MPRRKKRVCSGSGSTKQEFDQLMKEYTKMSKMMQGGKLKKMMQMMQMMKGKTPANIDDMKDLFE